MKMKKLARAGIEDAVAVITGFPLTGTASILLTDGLLPCIRSLFERTYLDWELKDWPHLYANESHLLNITHYHKTSRLPQVIIFDNSERALNIGDIYVSRSSIQFQVSKDIKARTEDAFCAYMKMLRWRNKVYHNDRNVRLKDLTISEQRLVLTVQNVAYEDYLRTNLVLDSEFNDHQMTLRMLVHHDKKLEPLSDSPLANNFGVNVLIFTIDGQLIIQKRSNKVIVRPNEYCPSASGTISALDIPNHDTPLSEVPLMREAMEELGYYDPDHKNVFMLGITRELIRGGQPELFLAARSSLSASEFMNGYAHAHDRFESKSLHFFKFDRYAFSEELDTPDKIARFISLVDKFIDRFKDRMSIPLWTAIALWKNARIAGSAMFPS